MPRQAKSNGRPPIVLRETEAERPSNLASQMEAKVPLAAGLLLDEIERAEIRADLMAELLREDALLNRMLWADARILADEPQRVH
jgi:hypothetical protein